MNVTRLRLENFKRHTELELDLVHGLNVVRGANEAGKTTIQRALEMVLFRRPTSSSQDLDETRPWHDAEADPVVEIEFGDDDATGTLRKTFAGQRGTVEMRMGDETLTDPAAVEAQVARLTGLPSEKFFRATASVHHQDLGGLTQDESTLRDRLQQAMSGADRGTHAARRKLEEAIRRYRTEGAKNPGYLKVMRTDVDRLRDQVKRGEAELADLERDRRSLADARAARITHDAQLAEQREGVAKAERAASLTARAADATRRYGQYRRAAELRDEIDKLEASNPSAIALASLRATVEQLRDLEFKLSEMRAAQAAEPELSVHDVSRTVPRWRPFALACATLLIGAAVVAGMGVALGWAVPGLAIAALLGAAGVFAAWRALGQRRLLNDIRLHNELRESELARRLSGRADLGERARQIEQDRAQALASLGSPDLARAEATLAAETERTSQIAARRAEYRGLLGDDPAVGDVGILRDAAAAEADQCRHALAGMGEMSNEPDRHLAGFQLAVQRLTPAREAALHAEAQADARVSANEVDAEKVAADGEALEAAEEALKSAERRLRIYEDVLNTLNDAERGTMKKAARFLEQRMARDIERITGGRYRRLKVDEATLTFSVFAPEANDWIDVRQLSQGTLDQLYLCARLGIVRQVTQPASPPLIFDDPFITFDDERARRALSLLKDIARDHQVIYLTTSDRYDAMADNVVVLPTPVDKDELEVLAPAAGPAETLTVWSAITLPDPATAPKAPRANPAVNGNGVPAPASAGALAALASGGELIGLGPIFGVASALSWGVGDFCGGLISRYASVLSAMLVSQSLGLVTTGLLLVLVGEPAPSADSLVWTAIAGFCGVGGLAFFYLALARGTMGVVAPLAAVIGAGLPVLVAIFGGESVDAARLLGIGFALAAVILISLPNRGANAEDRRALRVDLAELPMVVLAGLGFAGFFIGVDRAAAEGSIWWPLTLVRVIGLTLVVLAIVVAVALRRNGPMRLRAADVLGIVRFRESGRTLASALPLLILAGFGDLGGNVFFVFARGADSFAVAVVLSSLYPVVTTVLAAVVLRERLRPVQILGVVLATLCVPLLR